MEDTVYGRKTIALRANIYVLKSAFFLLFKLFFLGEKVSDYKINRI